MQCGLAPDGDEDWDKLAQALSLSKLEDLDVSNNLLREGGIVALSVAVSR